MIKTLTGLRSILFLFIFCTHFRWAVYGSEAGRSLFEILFLGRYGVLFFILLSGFCIALGYADKFSTISAEKYGNFLKKRLIKIYPLYVLTGLIALFVFQFHSERIQAICSFILSYLPMIQTWGIIKLKGVGNGVAWFVSIIFLCYLITPFILVVLNKIKDLKFHILFCIINYLILLSFSLILVAHNDSQNNFFYVFPPVRIIEYMIGLDVGFVYVKILKNKMNFEISSKLKNLIDILFIILFLFCIYWLPNNLLVRHALAMPLFCCLMIYLCYEKESILYNFLSGKLCNFIGNVSYECFLIHYLVLEILKPCYQIYIHTMGNLIMLFIGLFVLSVLLSYKYKNLQDKIIQQFIANRKNIEVK